MATVLFSKCVLAGRRSSPAAKPQKHCQNEWLLIPTCSRHAVNVLHRAHLRQDAQSQLAASSSASDSYPGKSIKELLRTRGDVSESDLSRAFSLYPELELAVFERAQSVVHTLLQIGLQGDDLAKVCLKHPEVLVSPPDRVSEVLEFLQDDLGLRGQELKALVVRFPRVLSYGVKAHLRPHLAYLSSLGEEDVRGLVRQRPHVLGEGIESIIKFLQLCRMPRKQVYRMLRSYPLDYCLKLRAPLAIAEIEAEERGDSWRSPDKPPG